MVFLKRFNFDFFGNSSLRCWEFGGTWNSRATERPWKMNFCLGQGIAEHAETKVATTARKNPHLPGLWWSQGQNSQSPKLSEKLNKFVGGAIILMPLPNWFLIVLAIWMNLRSPSHTGPKAIESLPGQYLVFSKPWESWDTMYLIDSLVSPHIHQIYQYVSMCLYIDARNLQSYICLKQTPKFR